jgi:hypothetical protein
MGRPAGHGAGLDLVEMRERKLVMDDHEELAVCGL